MSKKIFVGNIAWGVTEDDLNAAFSQHGEIEDLVILKDRYTHRSRGFGFVTFVNDEDAEKAVESLNGYNLNGRDLVVNEAKPPRKEQRY